MRFCLIVFGLVLPMLVFAGEVTIPNEFESGAKAVAADVNENFSVLASEVNDNDLRITANETAVIANTSNITTNSTSLSSKQNMVTGSCAAGSSIRAINTDGSVVCELDTVGGSGGGDITEITTAPTSGLIGGTSAGAANLAVDTNVIQRRITGTCAVGEVVRAIAVDGKVTCGTAPSEVISGAGLTDSTNPITSAVTLDVDPNYVQLRLNSGCAAGSSIRDISADGTPTCELDTVSNTTYSAGVGLSLTNNTFSLDRMAAFRVSMNSSLTILLRETSTLPFELEQYDFGDNFDPKINAFVVPENGFYHFSCFITPSTTLSSGNVRLYIGSDQIQVYGPYPAFQTIAITANGYYTAGREINCRFYYNGSDASYEIASTLNQFSGFRVH